MSTKKKDPNDVAFNASMRSNVLTRARLHKRIPKDKQYLHRVADEYADLQEKILKLEHAVWRGVPNPDGDLVTVYTDFAKGLPGQDRQLLVRQHKAMCTYRDILVTRLNRFKPNIFFPKK